MASSNSNRTESVSCKRPYENSNSQRFDNSIRPIKSFVLLKDKNLGYQAQVTFINNQLYLGLTKMWFDRSQNIWRHSRKSVFLPKVAFESLMNFLPEISNLMSFPPNGYIPVGPTYTPSIPLEEIKEDSF